MRPSLVDDALAHHVWATLLLIDTSTSLTDEQLNTVLPGTYGSILATLRHIVGGDSYYLSHLTGSEEVATDDMDLDQLRDLMVSDEKLWQKLIAKDLDPEAIVLDVDEGGYRREAALGTRLAQALYHGSDHRSQVCTTLTALGVEAPGIEVWDFGAATGRVKELPPTA